jgi:hypothetical protein
VDSVDSVAKIRFLCLCVLLDPALLILQIEHGPGQGNEGGDKEGGDDERVSLDFFVAGKIGKPGE